MLDDIWRQRDNFIDWLSMPRENEAEQAGIPGRPFTIFETWLKDLGLLGVEVDADRVRYKLQYKGKRKSFSTPSWMYEDAMRIAHQGRQCSYTPASLLHLLDGRPIEKIALMDEKVELTQECFMKWLRSKTRNLILGQPHQVTEPFYKWMEESGFKNVFVGSSIIAFQQGSTSAQLQTPTWMAQVIARLESETETIITVKKAINAVDNSINLENRKRDSITRKARKKKKKDGNAWVPYQATLEFEHEGQKI